MRKESRILRPLVVNGSHRRIKVLGEVEELVHKSCQEAVSAVQTSSDVHRPNAAFPDSIESPQNQTALTETMTLKLDPSVVESRVHCGNVSSEELPDYEYQRVQLIRPEKRSHLRMSELSGKHLGRSQQLFLRSVLNLYVTFHNHAQHLFVQFSHKQDALQKRFESQMRCMQRAAHTASDISNASFGKNLRTTEEVGPQQTSTCNSLISTVTTDEGCSQNNRKRLTAKRNRSLPNSILQRSMTLTGAMEPQANMHDWNEESTVLLDVPKQDVNPRESVNYRDTILSTVTEPIVSNCSTKTRDPGRLNIALHSMDTTSSFSNTAARHRRMYHNWRCMIQKTAQQVASVHTDTVNGIMLHSTHDKDSAQVENLCKIVQSLMHLSVDEWLMLMDAVGDVLSAFRGI